MDFFSAQDQARKNTSLLIFYYLLAVGLIVIFVYLACMLVLVVGPQLDQQSTIPPQAFWNQDIFGLVTAITICIVAIGSLYKVSQLSSGGSVVAEMLGGRLIPPNTSDPHERKTLNVVQEMAIASGTPVPPVYLLEDEEGINAFAAGYSPGNAVIGVTRGCIARLNRDELQGVIAHEFSHILNGDMRLNIRLIGILHGILIIALTGYFLMRTFLGGKSSRRSKDKDPTVALGLLGLLLMVIGYIGVFFGKLIKSAVSRQREYLADASAVQFTRNPSGIAGALKKIGGFISGSQVQSPKAEEASHMFFSNGVSKAFSQAMATHPPLSDRIRRIEPHFNGSYPDAPEVDDTSALHSEMASGFSPQTKRFAAEPTEVVSHVGAPEEKHLHYAHALLQTLPMELQEKIREVYGAQALIYGLLLSTDRTIQDAQLNHLSKNSDELILKETLRLLPLVSTLDTRFRLPLVDLCLPTLRLLSKPEYLQFKSNIVTLIQADAKVTLFEFALIHVLNRHLDQAFSAEHQRQQGRVRYTNLNSVVPQFTAVLSALAHYGSSTDTRAQKSFATALHDAAISEIPFLPRAKCSLESIDKGLVVLNETAPQLTKQILTACVSCIGTDGTVTLEEAELIRAIADAIDCPLPPIVVDI